ncbi:hypothetical protein [Streptomyces goshikiensis]|uniref:hypothetical protein n=1 Tax=Streptomyces goshikiensis TaxID=1942 RepID=UPI0022F3F645|nr:hypothetical protein [Streptomyces goshikiensis]WBY20025.1 hypothetical protein PET44_10525 [Streptomyces goshikiensis]
MKDASITQVVTAFSPVVIALITGYFGARLSRRSRSDKLMERLKAEIEAVQALPEGSATKGVLLSQIDATVRKYEETCQREDTFRRDAAGLVMGILIGGGGIALGTWAALAGGLYFWWWVLAIPAIIVGVIGFFYELAGGRANQAAAATTTPSQAGVAET